MTATADEISCSCTAWRRAGACVLSFLSAQGAASASSFLFFPGSIALASDSSAPEAQPGPASKATPTIAESFPELQPAMKQDFEKEWKQEEVKSLRAFLLQWKGL